MIISVIGIGFVGGAIKKSFELKNVTCKAYDKYKKIGTFEDCLNSDIMFLCLPTLFDKSINEYDKGSIIETCDKLEKNNYKGLVIIKSTVEPTTTVNLSKKFSKLKLIHNPEFLTAKTAFEDFHNQKHIVLGKGPNANDEDITNLEIFYKKNYPGAEISKCSSTESESMKSFVNCFYSVKVQFFNELYSLCNKIDCNYSVVKNLMLKNGWINPMHTQVPGTDGKLSYGGYCFPKDTNALLNNMKKNNSIHEVLEACISERNKMRKDDINIK